jgi:serine/threonine-protein kinase HipA
MSLTEPTLLRLRFLGEPMATLAYRPDLPAYALEFDQAFLDKGHDLSPLHLPMARFGAGLHLFRPRDTPFVGGLPGLIADSLPDAWGERMLRQELPSLQTVMGKLSAIGQRTPGAITYEPVIGSSDDAATNAVNIALMANEADVLRKTPMPLATNQINAALAHGGSSLGGAFPKISAHLPFGVELIDRKEILVGGPSPPAHAPCILKFTRSTDEDEGAVEFAFWLMARAAGIRVPPACLVNDGTKRHFACARFDRVQRADGGWARRHVHTLSGILHQRPADGVIDYEDFMRLTRRLCGAQEATECLRRAIFNLLSTNRDDHGRNHAFLYDDTVRTWTLSPAYDLNPNVANVLIGLNWLGSNQVPSTFDSVLKLAELGGINERSARSIFDEVEAATVGSWETYAKQAGVSSAMMREWGHGIERQTASLRADFRTRATKSNRKTAPAPRVKS